MSQQVFDPQKPKALTSKELDLFKSLRFYVQKEALTTFTSDTFRELGLDRFLKDPQHDIGYLFLKLKQHNLIEGTGQFVCSQLESNHGHRIQKWKLKNEREREGEHF